MIFNDFCKITERKLLSQHKEDYKILNDAVLFEFETIFGEAPKIKKIKHDEIEDYIYLPFPVTAIYNSEICYDDDNFKPETLTIFINREQCQGFDCHWQFINVLYSPVKYYDDIRFPESILIMRGTITKLEFDVSKERSPIDLNVSDLQTINMHNLTSHELDDVKPDDTEMRGYITEFAQSVTSIFTVIMQMNMLENLMVEKSSVKPPKKRKNKLLRKHERPEYVVIDRKEVRRYMGLPTEFKDGNKRKSPIPHGRRAHYKHLFRGTDRYKKRWWPAIWIGDRESIKGNRKYRVILGDENIKK